MKVFQIFDKVEVFKFLNYLVWEFMVYVAQSKIMMKGTMLDAQSLHDEGKREVVVK